MERAEQSTQTRSLEAIILGDLIINTGWGSEEFTRSNTRLKRVLDLGVDVKSPTALLGIALAEYMIVFPLLGITYLYHDGYIDMEYNRLID